MTFTTLTDIVLGLAFLAYIVSRQLRWIPVDTASMWRMPMILGAVGLLSLAGHTATITTVDVAILVLSAILAVGSGLAMGRLATFRPIAAPAPKPLRNGTLPTTESRVGWVGAGLWIGLIAARIGLDVAGAEMGAGTATSAGVILLVVAINRAARALVFSARLGHHVTRVA
ncbi:hypothetical protein [Cryptosporangium sp. NPDC051539]|uniref:hypothetical protein n=1 Tax=Cryptosporangium sp. NPDC051539 TaxID=3363962 RepID=UPI0037B26BF1